MSEFSEKLSYYITQSGYNVYQLAKEAALDRTTLQKTVKGQRLPSVDYIKDICSHINISKKQEEELLHLYRAEKLGHGVVESWDEIDKILVDIQRLREKKQSHNFLCIHFDQKSLSAFNEEKPLVCHQLVKLQRLEANKEGIAENFRILHQVLPYAFVFQKEYDIRYAYVTSSAEDNRYYLLPHYIVTHRHVFLCSEEPYRALLVVSEEMSEGYRRELEKMKHAYRPLFTYQGMSGEGIRMYRRMSEYCDIHVTMEECPCVALMVPEEGQEILKNDPAIGTYAEAFFDLPKENSSQFINIFGMKGMKNFIRTGHLPGLFDQYFWVEKIDDRRNMIENFHQHLLNRTRRFYMINEEKFSECGGYGIELFGKNKVVFYSTSLDFSFGFITIDEPGIGDVFYSYFENLLESECVYSVEETIVKYEEIVEEVFGKLE